MLILELGKFRIAQMVTLSTATGYILAAGHLSFHMLIPVFGILLMALGSGALNQYQERDKDAIMPRTKHRPIPSGKISPVAGLFISFVLILSGALVLLFGANLLAAFLGILTAFWYNVVYTYLKRITPMAVVPGSLIGSLPPLVGWASAGGNILQPEPLAIALFFFIWQIPHFWLLLMNFGRDYETAGYPSLTATLGKSQLGRMTFMWIVATAASILVLPLFGFGHSIVTIVFLFLASVFLVWSSKSLLNTKGRELAVWPAFKSINIFILSVMLLLTLDKLIA